MRKNFTALLILLVSLLVLNAGAAAKEGPEFDEAFVREAFENYGIEAAFQLLLNRDIPVQRIIMQAQETGYNDAKITDALLQSNVSTEKVVLHAINSHMSPARVLERLDSHGVDPQTVLNMLVENDISMNRILSTCEYMLDQGRTPEEVVSALHAAGASRSTIIKAESRFDIPPATTVEVYRERQAEFGGYGHVYTRHSLPQPALIAIGVERINVSDTFDDRNPVSPSSP